MAVASLFLAFAAVSAKTSASEGVSQDGLWWHDVPADAKIYVVVGMLSAYQAAHSTGQVFGYGKSADAVLDASAKRKISYAAAKTLTTAMASYNSSSLDSPQQKFSKTMGTYEHGLDDYYANYPEAVKTPVGNVVGCLADKPAETCEHLAKSWSR